MAAGLMGWTEAEIHATRFSSSIVGVQLQSRYEWASAAQIYMRDGVDFRATMVATAGVGHSFSPAMKCSHGLDV